MGNIMVKETGRKSLYTSKGYCKIRYASIKVEYNNL
jgi:hypothetical protein